MQIKYFNEEVVFADDKIVKVGAEDVAFLKEKAMGNKRRRMRLCTHQSIEDKVHEMLILHEKDTYVRPHKHLNKSESFHIIEGIGDIILFNEEGCISEIIRMGDYSSAYKFYYRISAPYYHTLLIRSEFLIFHETTNGPFKRSDTIFPSWAPDEEDGVGQKSFMKQMAIEAESFSLKNFKKIS